MLVRLRKLCAPSQPPTQSCTATFGELALTGVLWRQYGAGTGRPGLGIRTPEGLTLVPCDRGKSIPFSDVGS